MIRSVVGLDVGGANLKAAHSLGPVLLQPFELWRDPGALAGALKALLGRLPAADLVAVTMTGELCDCFDSKREGVSAILDAVEQAAGDMIVRVWTTAARLVDVAHARANPIRTAAANWMALAIYAGQWLPSGFGLLIDVGSTTTDIVPLAEGKPVPRGLTDPERLRLRELVYTGCRRTPLCALLGGDSAAEFFAQTLDAYVVLGLISEACDDRNTADGRPVTKKAAHRRLAHMMCGDADSCPEGDTIALAHKIADRQIGLIRDAIDEICLSMGSGVLSGIVLAGSGEFLARMAVSQTRACAGVHITSLHERLGPVASEAACAFALCKLAVAHDCRGG